MKEKLKKLPPPLRKQALLRFAGAGACFCLLLVVAVGYCQPMLWFPFLVMGAFSAWSGALLMWRVDQGKVLVLEGVCWEVELTLFRRRPKAVVMECGIWPWGRGFASMWRSRLLFMRKTIFLC